MIHMRSRLWPRCLFEWTAELLGLVEGGAPWPAPALWGRIALVDKGEGPEVDKQRPITVLNLLYRWWTGGRLEDFTTWMAGWCAESCGARPGGSCEEVWVRLGRQDSDNQAPPVPGRPPRAAQV